MNSKEIRALLELLREYGLTEIEVEREGERLRLRREPVPPPPALAAPAASGPSRAPEEVAAARGPVEAAAVLTIDAPMVGTFYGAPAPDAQPYVREGDVVKKGQIVCIIEAMKLMNEIEAKVAGRVAKVLVESAQPVEYGQPLFVVEP
jgi:acetyl-CoA carboxylase biotin carboxyl carrier protein